MNDKPQKIQGITEREASRVAWVALVETLLDNKILNRQDLVTKIESLKWLEGEPKNNELQFYLDALENYRLYSSNDVEKV